MSTTMTAATDVSSRPVFHGLTPVYFPQRNPAINSMTNDTMVEMRRARAHNYKFLTTMSHENQSTLTVRQFHFVPMPQLF